MEMDKTSNEEQDVTTRTTRTVITRSYDGDQDMSQDMLSLDTTNNSLDDVVLSSSYITPVGRLDKAQDDLSSYKKRIDANVEQQREHADMMASLQRKVHEYRRRFADIEGHIASQHTSHDGMTFSLKEEEGDVSESDFNTITRIQEEHRKYEECRVLLGQERMLNEQLQHDLHQLKQQCDMTLRDKDRLYMNKEKSLTQYLNEEQSKMMGLWSELQQVRQQCSEYKEQTERDLENQKNELLKVLRSVGGVARQLNLSTIQDNTSALWNSGGGKDQELIEAVQRFTQQQAVCDGTAQSDYQQLLNKYEESIDRIVQLESVGNNSTHHLSEVQLELKRTKDRLNDCLEVLFNLQQMSHETCPDITVWSDISEVVPSEVQRAVKSALRVQNKNIQVLQRNVNNTNSQLSQLECEYTNSEEARKRLDGQIAGMKQQLIDDNKKTDDANREVRKLEERIRNMECDKTTYDKQRTTLQQQVQSLKGLLEKASMDAEQRYIQDTEQRCRLLDEDYAQRMNELNGRLETAQQHNKQMKMDWNALQDKMRDLDIEHKNTLSIIEQKDKTMKSLESVKEELLNDLDKERTRTDAMSSEVDSLHATCNTSNKKTAVLEALMKQVKLDRDELSRDKDELNGQLSLLNTRLENESKKRQELINTNNRHAAELDKMKSDMTENESQLLALTKDRDELDTQTHTLQAKLLTVQGLLKSAQQENMHAMQLKSDLLKERQEVVMSQQKTLLQSDTLKETLSRMQCELDKVNNENALLVDKEQTAQQLCNETNQKISLLEQDLQDATRELDQAKMTLDNMNQDKISRVELALTQATPSEDISLQHTISLDQQQWHAAKDQLETRIHELEGQLSDSQHTIEQYESELQEMKDKHELQLEDIQNEMSVLINKHGNELEDVQEDHIKTMDDMKSIQQDIQVQLNTAQRSLSEAMEHKNIVNQQYEQCQLQLDNSNKQIVVLKDDLDRTRDTTHQEITRCKKECSDAQNETSIVQSDLETVKTQLSAATDKNNSLSNSISQQTANIRDLNNTLQRVQEELEQAQTTTQSKQSELDSTMNRLHSVEEQYASVVLHKSNITNQLDSLQRELQLLKSTHSSTSSELERTVNKMQLLNATIQEQTEEALNTRNERDQLERAYREKCKQVDQLKELAQTFDSRMNRMRQQVHDTNEQLVQTQVEKDALDKQVTKLQTQVQFGVEQLERKSVSFNSALDELSNAHRIAQEARLDAVQQLESSKYRVIELESSLSNTEQRLASVQQDYNTAHTQRTALNDSVRRFQQLLNPTKTLNRLVLPEEGQDTIHKETVLDLSALDTNLQSLVSRTDKLEREKNEYRNQLSRLKRKTSDSSLSLSKQETLFKSVEDRLTDAEQDRHTLEMRLNCAKELLKSQEEALKQKDEERRQLKSKTLTLELTARGKEAQLRHVNEQCNRMRRELNDTHKSSVKHNDVFDSNKMKGKYQEDTQRVALLMSSFETEKQTLKETIKRLTAQVQSSDSLNTQLRDDLDNIKRTLSRTQNDEKDLRRSLQDKNAILEEVTSLKDQLKGMQNELNTAQKRRQELDNELSSMRGVNREEKQRVYEANQGVAHLQRQLQEAHNLKNRLDDNISSMSKSITQHRNKENDLQSQLLSTNNEKKSAIIECEGLRVRLEQLNNELRSAKHQLQQLNNTKLVLINKIQLLETDKTKAEAVINETGSQREAIERSLSALERENKELYKNSAQLQQQVAQLEMDNGNRLITMSNQQRDQHDRFVRSIKEDKCQFERMVESRDRTQKNRIKQLESQLNLLREQLTKERARIGNLKADNLHSFSTMNSTSLGADYFRTPLKLHTASTQESVTSLGSTSFEDKQDDSKTAIAVHMKGTESDHTE